MPITRQLSMRAILLERTSASWCVGRWHFVLARRAEAILCGAGDMVDETTSRAMMPDCGRPLKHSHPAIIYRFRQLTPRHRSAAGKDQQFASKTPAQGSANN